MANPLRRVLCITYTISPWAYCSAQWTGVILYPVHPHFPICSIMAKSRNWCFTINNPNDDPLIIPIHATLLIATRETGEWGTPHWQGYVEFKHAVPLSTLRNWDNRGHYEIRKGTQLQAIKYCVKDFFNEDGEPAMFMDGAISTISGFGFQTYGIDETLTLKEFLDGLETKTTSKLTRMKQLIDEGKSDKDLADYDFDTWCRSYRALAQYRLLCIAPRNWEMEVIVLYGPTGTGKSKYCFDNYPDPYWKQRGKWWDNYSHQETVVLDEFYGWLQWDVLLRLCDRYPLLVETKGGQIQFSTKRIVFTSNTVPSKWYKGVYFDAFVRRVNKWVYMPTLGNKLETGDYKEFLNFINLEITQI